MIFSNTTHGIPVSESENNYPGARTKIAYEAGFCGFGIQRALSKYADVECIVVNAADVPTSDK